MGHHKQPQTVGGFRLRALREACGQTQLAVELEASLGLGYLQRLELGKVQQPARDTLERILAVLSASFIERRDILESFGYTTTVSIPTEADIQWATNIFQSETANVPIPAYLLDCSHRLLAWNSLVPRLFQAIEASTRLVSLPQLIFDPVYQILPAVLNSDDFFSTEVRILQYERQRWGREANGWYQVFVDEMRHFQTFDRYWRKLESQSSPIPMRPSAQLKLKTARGLAQFRLISETFAPDPRFRVIYYVPSDSATNRLCLNWQN